MSGQQVADSRTQYGRDDLLDAITTDTTRKPFERETRFSWSGGTNAADIHTAERSLMRRLLSHPEFELDWFECRNGDRGSRAVYVHEMAEEWDGEDVLSINGTIPIGCVSLKSSPRKADSHARVVSRKVLEDDDGGA